MNPRTDLLVFARVKFAVFAWIVSSLFAARPLLSADVPPRLHPAPGSPDESAPAPRQEAKDFVLDATTKECMANDGDSECRFDFVVTNVSDAEVVINEVHTSCGCTTARIPTRPWVLAPHSKGTFQIAVDLRGKTGVLVKTATIETPNGFKEAVVKITIPKSTENGETRRLSNLQMAAVDRQAVFKGDCAACHAQPMLGLQGHALYVAACAICHDAEHRATMVPSLSGSSNSRDSNDWKRIVADGKTGTLMPAFALSAGGPLSEKQIESLVEYLELNFPKPAETPSTSRGSLSSGAHEP